MKNIPYDFPISIFENNQEKISDTLTKKRVRIFYKGRNRNGSYISDEFAEQLIKTLPYTPVKGIYTSDKEDFEGHGEKRTEGRIYGIVPKDLNFAWEKHMDEDGVEREYACADILLFTALYKEAGEIDGKGQSMELYPPSIKGEWIVIDGLHTYKYSEASFLGLQILGDNVEPCFEGSSFFSLQEQQVYTLFMKLLEKIDNLDKGGNSQMKDTVNFALSDNQKQNAIFKAVNSEKVQYFVMDTYDTYAILYDMEEDKIKKVTYTKENDNVVVGNDFEELFAEYVTSSEKEALNSLREKTEEKTFYSLEVDYENKKQKIIDMQTEIDNKNIEISTLKQDAEEKNIIFSNLETEIENYKKANSELESFKNNIATKNKKQILDKYRKKLNQNIIANYENKLDDFSEIELEKELAYELVQEDSSIFSLDKGQEQYVPLEHEVSGIEALLEKYKTKS